MSTNYSSIESCFELSSDHSPVIAAVQNQVVLRNKPPSLYNQKPNWESFRDYVSSHLKLNKALNSEDNINEAVEHFNLCIQQAGWLIAKENYQKKRTNPHQSYSKYYLRKEKSENNGNQQELLS